MYPHNTASTRWNTIRERKITKVQTRACRHKKVKYLYPVPTLTLLPFVKTFCIGAVNGRVGKHMTWATVFSVLSTVQAKTIAKSSTVQAKTIAKLFEARLLQVIIHLL